MNLKTTIEQEVEDASWNLRKDIKSICGVYDTVITDKMEKAMTQAMNRAAMAVLDELEWKNKGFHSGSEVVTWSDEKREEIKSTLTKE